MFKNRILWFLSVIIICAFANAAIYYVKTDGSDSNTGIDWVNAFQTITKAMDVVSADDVVWIAAGIYKEGESVYIPRNVTVYGGFSGIETELSERNIYNHQVIIDGNERHQCLSNAGTLDGLFVRNGKDHSMQIANDMTGGIMNYKYGTVINCSVFDNEGDDVGGIFNYGTVIDCKVYNNSGSDGAGIYNNGSDSIVTNCKVFGNNSEFSGGGILNFGTVVNSIIYDNSARTNGGGIENRDGAISNCIVYNNWVSTSPYVADSAGGGIHNSSGSVTNCTLYGNSALYDLEDGLYNYDGTVTNCILWGNSERDIYCNSSHPGNVSYCCFQNGSYVSGEGNIQQEPLFFRTTGHESNWDFHLQEGSPCIDTGTSVDAPEDDTEGTIRPQGKEIDMGAFEFPVGCKAIFDVEKCFGGFGSYFQFYDVSQGNPDHWAWDFQSDGIIDSYAQNPQFAYSAPGYYTVSLTVSKGDQENTKTKVAYIYVGTRYYVKKDGQSVNLGLSWDEAFPSIYDALLRASEGDDIWVAAGVYQLGYQITVPENITVYGGFDGSEVSFSERDIDENKVIIDGNGSLRCFSNSGVLDGLYVRNGNAGGIINQKEGVVKNCWIYQNYSESSGGGIPNYGIVKNSMIFDNYSDSSGGGMSNSGMVSNCEIYGNSALVDGGGITNSSSGIVTNCKLYKNHGRLGGGIYNYKGNITSSILYENIADSDGGICNHEGNVGNCIIYNNLASDSCGGISNSLGIVTNCTVSGNISNESGGISNYSGLATNCISWYNSPFDIYNSSNSPGTVSYCSYQSGSGISGENNINQEPQLINESGESSTCDFHLQAGSSCIDSGSSDDAPATDIDGEIRPQGGGVDIGAYEFSLDCKAVFYADKRSGRPGLKVQFQDASYGEPNSWAWDFQGDGVIDSYEQNPLFVYEAPGRYTVSLRVGNATNADTEIKTEYIHVGQRYYVSKNGNDDNDGLSWDSAFMTITKALNSVFSHDEIWVAEGNYQEGAELKIPGYVTIYGGFSGIENELSERRVEEYQTIIDGNNSHRCIYNSGILNGLYVTYGKTDSHGAGIYNSGGTLINCIIYYNNASGNSSRGGGVYNSGFGNVWNCTVYRNTVATHGSGIYNISGIIANCTVKSNTAGEYGNGGIYNKKDGIVTDCVVYDNASGLHGSGIYNIGTVSNCRVYSNRAYSTTNFNNYSNGGGIYNTGTVSNCVVHDNNTKYGGGIYNSGIVTDCTFYRNNAHNDGGGIYNTSGYVSNCEVYSNSTHCGESGGISNESGDIINCSVLDNAGGCGIKNAGTILNCLVYANLSRTESGGVTNSGTMSNCTVYGNDSVGIYNKSGSVANCIAWGNASHDIECDEYYPGNVSYSCYATEMNVADSDNIIGLDPLFCNTTGESKTWDFHLQSDSPCIDIGTLVDGPQVDFEGIARPQGDGMDLGAYEFTSECRAVFYADKNFGQPDLSVQFQDDSYGNPDSWAWDFQNDGIIDSYEQNPQFIYQTAGYYSVSLTVSNGSLQDTKTKLGYIYVGYRYYVDLNGNNENNGKSWESPFMSISKAVKVANTHDEVWVAAGVYLEGFEINVPQDVAVYGGFSGIETSLSERDIDANRVIIDGASRYQCVYNYGTVDGFCVTKGKINSYEGAAIENYWGTVTNCRIYNNKATSSFNPYVIRNVNGFVSNCLIYENQGDGIKNYGTVVNCTVYGNSSKGINNSGSVANCTVYGNNSIGISNSGSVANCTVYSNKNGGIFNHTDCTVLNSIVYSNTSEVNGSGIYNKGVVTNCTVYGNSSSESCSGIFNDDGTVINCIVWGNSSNDITCDSDKSGNVSFSCYENGENISGHDNIQQDPLFVNVSGESVTWDFHLQSNSPCIDSGTATNAPDTDIEETSRPQGSGFDIGAYEYIFPLTSVEHDLWSLMK